MIVPRTPLPRSSRAGSALAGSTTGGWSADRVHVARSTFAGGSELVYAGSVVRGLRCAGGAVGVAPPSGPLRLARLGSRCPFPEPPGRGPLAADGYGGAAAVIHRRGRASDVLEVAVKPRGSDRFGAPRPLVRRKRIEEVAATSNASGDLLVAWQHGRTVAARVRSASGQLGRVTRLRRTNAAGGLSAALDDAGAFVVAWIERDSPQGGSEPRARIVAATGRGQVRALEAFKRRGVDSAGLRVVAIGADRFAIAWGGDRAFHATIVQAGRVGPVRRLGPRRSPSSAYEEADGGLSGIAAGPGGSAIVAWEQDSGPAAAFLPPGADRFGRTERIAAAEVMKPDWLVDHYSDVTIDPHNHRAIVAWTQRGTLSGLAYASRPLPGDPAISSAGGQPSKSRPSGSRPRASTPTGTTTRHGVDRSRRQPSGRDRAGRGCRHRSSGSLPWRAGS
jgi:hypothetical protein